MRPAPPSSGRWLFGPSSDLLLGCGVGYLLLFAAFAVGGAALRAREPAYLLPLLVVFLSFPHYGATLVRVYEQRVDRRRYAVFSVWVTLAIVAAFAVGLRDVFAGSLLLTVYATWSPWHYSGQNYGIAVMFLRRRGAEVTPQAKRLLYTSFLLSFAMVFVVFHAGEGEGAVLYNAVSAGGSGIRFLPLGIPEALAQVAVPALALASLGCLLGSARILLRTATPRDLLPAGVLALTQAVWFSIPYAFSFLGLRTGLEPVDQHLGVREYAFWVAFGHSAQYLWVTTYYARQSQQGWHGYARYLGKTFFAGFAIWTLPLVLFSPDLFGPPSYLEGVALLSASAINLHHVILDGAIWKLRDGRIARVLVRRPPAGSGEPGGVAVARPWGRRLGWAAVIGFVLIQVAGTAEYQLNALAAMDPLDPERLRASAQRLRWLGKPDPDIHYRLGVAAGERGDLGLARREFERSLELQVSARGWVGISFVEVEEGRPERARHALEQAVRLEPRNPEAWARAADVWVALGDLERARGSVARALELAPEREDLRRQQAQIAGRAGEGG
jgi:tetratricopeptide (TPR) repeat protein